jgi:glycosyltransferase involved in cell wall biosynthesis
MTMFSADLRPIESGPATRARRAPLRIAMVAPPWYEVPPRGYGGIETMVAGLVDQLVARGHEVTLVGAGRSGTRASQFFPVFEEPPSARVGQALPEVLYAAAVGRILADLDVDVVHDHSLAGPLSAPARAVPTVVTLHGPAAGEAGEILAHLGNAVHVVAISDAQRIARPDVNWVGRVHNAVDVSSFPYRESKDDVVLWMGRFTPDKGPDLAVDAARRAGVPIVLAGKCVEPEERRFFDERIAPRLADGVTCVGQADGPTKRELLSRARALVFPIRWDEPFGMVMVEALACGTPVIATARGSVPEIIRDGRNGLVLSPEAGIDELARAIRAVRGIRPAVCRAWARGHFDLPAMAERYEEIYLSLVAGVTPPPALAMRFGGGVGGDADAAVAPSPLEVA